eukprot:8927138-Pyramimonas_sp.AAC.1
MAAAPSTARLRPCAGHCTLPLRRPRLPWAARLRPGPWSCDRQRIVCGSRPSSRADCAGQVSSFLPAHHRHPVGHGRP